MARTCGWCGTAIAEGGDPRGSGLCPACTVRLEPDQKVSVQEIIDPIPAPVLVVDDDIAVSLLNQRGREVLGLGPERARGRRAGELFRCIHDLEPGGCGRTIHCSGCALRRVVTAVCQSGEPQFDVPATLRVGDPDRPEAVAMTVSAFKRGEVVMVKIDRGGR